MLCYNDFMQTDVAELRGFYTSALGRMVQRQLRALTVQFWPDVRQMTVLAVGYGTPVLRPFLEDAQRVLAFMPARQGVIPWPRGEGERNRTALVDPYALPLPDASVDRLLLIHALEGAAEPDRLLEEAWRVLAGNGRLLVIVPNRSGLWALSDSTPFGHGVAFSSGQVRGMLKRHNFIPEHEGHALFFPPSSSAFWLRTAPLWESLGKQWMRGVAGIRAVEASKQLYIPNGKTDTPQQRIRRVSSPVPVGLRVS